MKIVILSGAGISAESGVETFRASSDPTRMGLWEQYPVEQVATPEGFAADPELVHHFYNLRRQALATVKPNPAHYALGRLESELKARGGQMTLVTQNVDNLHERGGVQEVIHMQGALTSALCSACGWRWEQGSDLSVTSLCPSCQTRGGPRPDIVWFGEIPYHMERIEARLLACDLFVSIGTSGAVYPAAGFVQRARALGKDTLEINLDPSDGSHYFDETRHGKAGTLVPQWVGEILGDGYTDLH